MKKLLITTALVLGISSPQMAQAADTYFVDAAHTNVLLSVSHLGFSNMVLEALKPKGTLVFDPNNLSASTVNITLKAVHIDGDNEKFNGHLHSADFFNAAVFSDITFKSKNVKLTGDNSGVVTGELTLLGITKPVDLDVRFNKAGTNPFTKAETIGFTASGTLKRSEFGLGYGLPVIGDDVKIDINLEAIKQN